MELEAIKCANFEAIASLQTIHLATATKPQIDWPARLALGLSATLAIALLMGDANSSAFTSEDVCEGRTASAGQGNGEHG